MIGLALALALAFTAVFVGRPVEVRAEESTGEITVNYNSGKLANIRVNGIDVNPGTNKVTGKTGSGETNTIVLVTYPGSLFQTKTSSDIQIKGSDGTDISGYSVSFSDGSTGDQIATCNGVKADTSYTINVQTKSSDSNTIVWAYDKSTYGEDAFVEHGTIDVKSVNGNPPIEISPQHILAKKDDIIIIELKPDYGYQIAGVSINGGATLKAQTAISQFEFKMPGVPIHFKGIFIPSTDQVENKASAVVSGGNIANGNVIAQSGNAKVTFSDAETNVTGTISLSEGETRDTSKNVQSVNITTDEIVSKGESNQYWTNPQTVTTGGEAEISLTVNQKATGYAVIRTHGPENKEIPSTYDPDSGTLTFGSDRFSTYTLVPLTTSKNDYVIRYPQGSGNSSILQENGGKQEGGHSHQFEWETITTPTAETDGLEAYACIICGYYTDSVPVSAYSYACTEGAKQVLAAGQNAEITLKMGRWCSYPRWFMEKLAQRRDLTIHLQFEYLHKQYEVLIPAKMPVDTECEWYGPLKLCNLYPYTIK